jgi:hypothetical protein
MHAPAIPHPLQTMSATRATISEWRNREESLRLRIAYVVMILVGYHGDSL